MKIFKLYWKTGQESFIKGETAEEAFQKGNYSGGSLRALDYYEEINELPQKMKSFEVVSDNGMISEIVNPSFIEQLKQNELLQGLRINIRFASRIFSYELIDITNYSFRFKEIQTAII